MGSFGSFGGLAVCQASARSQQQVGVWVIMMLAWLKLEVAVSRNHNLFFWGELGSHKQAHTHIFFFHYFESPSSKVATHFFQGA